METCRVYRGRGTIPGVMAVAYQRPSEGEGWQAFLKVPLQVSYSTFDNETPEAAIESMEKFIDRRVCLRVELHPDL